MVSAQSHPESLIMRAAKARTLVLEIALYTKVQYVCVYGALILQGITSAILYTQQFISPAIALPVTQAQAKPSLGSEHRYDRRRHKCA